MGEGAYPFPVPISTAKHSMNFSCLKSKKIIVFLFLLAFLIFPSLSLAADLTPVAGLDSAAPDALKKSGTIEVVVGQMISALLSMLAVIFIILIIYAGFLWMTASGEESKIKKAKDIIIAATIGLVIVLASYSITIFVMSAMGIK